MLYPKGYKLPKEKWYKDMFYTTLRKPVFNLLIKDVMLHMSGKAQNLLLFFYLENISYFFMYQKILLGLYSAIC